MKTHGTLFNPEMGQAVYEERKWQTRRILKPQPMISYVVHVKDNLFGDEEGELQFSTPYKVGDRIVAKEHHWAYGWWKQSITEKTKAGGWKRKFLRDTEEPVLFNAPKSVVPSNENNMFGWYKRNSLFMPLADARSTRIITDVRIQRLQDISEEDAIAEGVRRFYMGGYYGTRVKQLHGTARRAFQDLINSINGPDTWESNPWVVAYSFEVERENVYSI